MPETFVCRNCKDKLPVKDHAQSDLCYDCWLVLMGN
jgi:hypothetical protein